MESGTALMKDPCADVQDYPRTCARTGTGEARRRHHVRKPADRRDDGQVLPRPACSHRDDHDLVAITREPRPELVAALLEVGKLGALVG